MFPQSTGDCLRVDSGLLERNRKKTSWSQNILKGSRRGTAQKKNGETVKGKGMLDKRDCNSERRGGGRKTNRKKN